MWKLIKVDFLYHWRLIAVCLLSSGMLLPMMVDERVSWSGLSVCSGPLIIGLAFVFIKRVEEQRDRLLVPLPVRDLQLGLARACFYLFLYAAGLAMMVLSVFLTARELIDERFLVNLLFISNLLLLFLVFMLIIEDVKLALRGPRRWLVSGVVYIVALLTYSLLILNPLLGDILGMLTGWVNLASTMQYFIYSLPVLSTMLIVQFLFLYFSLALYLQRRTHLRSAADLARFRPMR